MERPRLGSLASGWLLLLLCLLIQNPDLCASIHEEGRGLLRLKSRGVAGEDAAASSDAFGVDWETGEVIALNLGTTTNRKLLQRKERVKGENRRQSPNPSPAPSPNSPHASSSSPLPPLEAPSRSPGPHLIVPAPAQSPLSLRTSRDNRRTRTSRSTTKSHSSPRNHDHIPSPSPSRATSPLPSHSPSPSSSPSPSPSPSPALSPSPSPSPSPSSSPTSVLVLAPAPNSSFSSALPSPSTKTSQSKKHMVLILGVSVGSFGFVAFLTIFIHFYRGKKVVTVKPWTTGLSGQLQKAFVTGVPQLKRSELETACEDFSNIIGSLSDCILYKGTLSSGVEIAVASTLITCGKKWSKLSEAQFRKKIATLSKVNHKNFVNLLGYCEEEEPFTRMLVFEYAPNGTLFEHLHVKEAEDLDWAARLRIGMGIAYCLDHMHHLDSPVILSNLQSSSIYLTDDLAAKIADFDFSSETTMVPVSASGSSGPLDAQIIRPDSIVYKFGILLLEIVSGRVPYSEDNGLPLDWASDYLRGSSNLREVVDPSLKTFSDEAVQAIGEVIHRCCDPEPQARPTMKEVAARLKEITAVPPDGAVPRSSALWWAELEILSTEAN